MTCREKLKLERPELVGDEFEGGCGGCPHHYGYTEDGHEKCETSELEDFNVCEACWDREVENETPERPELELMWIHSDDPSNVIGTDVKVTETDNGLEVSFTNGPGYEETRRILDSGHRREFETGAVRDIHEGKGRCDLLPLDVVSNYLNDDHNTLDDILMSVYSFQRHNDNRCLITALYNFAYKRGWDCYTMLLEVAKHFEEGCKKYGDNNWQKGIPTHCYIDSAVRHYLKYLRGDKDEPHDRAFCWNIICCIWTCIHHPELNDYAKKEEENHE